MTRKTGFFRTGVFFVLALLVAGCDGPVNSPYPGDAAARPMLFSAFGERPKTLDPARSYSEDQALFVGNIYEPPLQYHYLKRPYQLEPLTAVAMPQVRYFDAGGRELAANVAADAPTRVAVSEYEIRLKPGTRYQPHPCFAKRADGSPRYQPMDAAELAGIRHFQDFTEVGSRELIAADYVYQIRRLAHPGLQSPILGLMADYIVGLKDLAQILAAEAKKMRETGKGETYLDISRPDFAGAYVVDRYTYRVRIKGKYPQFLYWLSMSFFAPVPEEAERFYRQPGMVERNFTLDWQPVGTGAFYLAENDPNRVMRLRRNPNFRPDFYPAEGDPGDREAGLLADAGRRLPLIEEAVFSLEKEDVPYWNKFLQGYYDASGISSDSFDQAIRIGPGGKPDLTPAMRERGIQLSTAARPSLWYLGFNMADPVLGGLSERARKLRQAIAIVLDYDEFISIFTNGRGEPAHGPIPPGIFGYRAGETGINPVVFRWKNGKAERRTLTEAKQLLAAAGYPGGRESATGKPLTLYFDTMASGPEAKSRLDWFRKQFARLDIQLVVRATDYNRFQDKMQKGNAQIFEWGWNADYPDPENFLFLLYGPNAKIAGGGENTANYRNPEFDRLFERMKDMDNSPERQALIDRMVDILRTDVPWVFAYFSQSFGLRHAWVGNAKPNQMAHNALKYRRVDPALRVAYQARWNRPVLWPIGVTLLLVVVAVWPAVAGYRRHLKATARVGAHV